MSRSRQVLIFGGLALAALGMAYGLYYAVFAEHQALDAMGGLLTGAFLDAARRDPPSAHSAVAAYAAARYDYVRQVDAHSHWIGLAMLLIVLGAAFDQLTLAERLSLPLALALLTGSIAFPLGVILQTLARGAAFASAIAVLGAALVTAALALIALAFLRRPA